MPRSKTPTISLEEAKARFEEWRRTRKGKAAIPDELWSAAAEVARKEGVSRTSTELRVEWNELKRRMPAAMRVSRQTAPPAFVELVAPEAGAESFASPEQLASWVGVCPGREESAEVSKSNRSPKGNRMMRRLLTHVANGRRQFQGQCVSESIPEVRSANGSVLGC